MFSKVTVLSFIVFTMFAAPCFAAIGAMKRELGSRKELGFALLFQTGVAYVSAMVVNLVGSLLLRGTDWVTPVTMDYTIMEEISEETEILPGNIVLYAFAGIIIIALIVMIFSTFKARARYRSAGNKA